MKEVVALTKLAEDAIKKNELKLAKVALVKAIKLNPTSAPSYMLLGNAYYLLGDKLNSIKCYLAAIHIQISTFTKMQTATFSTMLNIKSIQSIFWIATAEITDTHLLPTLIRK